MVGLLVQQKLHATMHATYLMIVLRGVYNSVHSTPLHVSGLAAVGAWFGVGTTYILAVPVYLLSNK